AALVSVQGAGTRRHLPDQAAAGTGIFLYAPAAPGPGTRRAGHLPFAPESGRPAIARGPRPPDRLQSFLSEPHFFESHRPDHPAVFASTAHGQGGRTAAHG